MNKHHKSRRFRLLGFAIAVALVLLGSFYIICHKLGEDKEQELSARVVVSWDGRYQSVGEEQEAYFTTLLMEALQLQKAELEATNGMVLLEGHRFKEDTGEDFTIEVVFEEALDVWIYNEDGERAEKEIYGIFYAPGRFSDVVDFAGSPELAEKGDYSMEYMGVMVNKRKLTELREEIRKFIRSRRNHEKMLAFKTNLC